MHSVPEEDTYNRKLGSVMVRMCVSVLSAGFHWNFSRRACSSSPRWMLTTYTRVTPGERIHFLTPWPAGTRRNNKVFITSKRRRRRRFDVIIASCVHWALLSLAYCRQGYKNYTRSLHMLVFCYRYRHGGVSQISLQWRHSEHNGVSNHQPHDCLLNRLFKAQIKENIKAPRHWPLWGESTGDRWIPCIKCQLRRKFDDVIMDSGHMFGKF